jgi:hypothetical protein
VIGRDGNNRVGGLAPYPVRRLIWPPFPPGSSSQGSNEAGDDYSRAARLPAPRGHVRWRLIDLVQWLHEEFAVSLDETTVGRELKKLGYVKLTARPRHHAQNDLAMEAFKKGALPPSWQRSKQPFRAELP